MKKRAFAALGLVLMLLAGLASAQIDDRARELLEGLNPGGLDLEITSLDQSMTMTMYQGDEQLVTTSRMVIDYAGRRAALVSEVMGTTTTMVHQDGTTVMKMGGMNIPVPAGMDSMFDGAFDQSATSDLLDDPDAVATYDGEVAYADVLAGHQVTYTGDFGMPGAGIDATTIRFIFDDSGRLLGQVIDVDGTDMAYVFVGEPKVEGVLYYDAEMYEIKDGFATRFATVTYDSVTINEPVDEALFE